MVPADDLERVREWAAGQIEPEHSDRIRIEVAETPDGVEISECHPPWEGSPDAPWTRLATALLRYDQSRREWALLWADGDSRYQPYPDVAPSQDLMPLLDEIDADPHCLFWG